MTILDVSYSTGNRMPEEVLPEFVDKLVAHLSPTGDLDLRTEIGFEDFKRAITEAKTEEYVSVREGLRFDQAAQYAKDLGLFELDDEEAVKTLQKERYDIGIHPHGVWTYEVELWPRCDDNGQRINQIGMRLKADTWSPMDSVCSRLVEQERSEQMCTRGEYQAQSSSEKLKTALAPRSEEEKLHREHMVVKNAVNMLRFQHDFFDRALEYERLFCTTWGLEGNVLLTAEDIARIVAYPCESIDNLKQIFEAQNLRIARLD